MPQVDHEQIVQEAGEGQGWLASLYHENTKITAANLPEIEARINDATRDPEHLRPCPAIHPSSKQIRLRHQRWPWGLDRLIRRRRTIRSFGTGAISLRALSRILCNASGVTQTNSGSHQLLPWPLRATPSAGAIYPLEITVAAMKVKGLEEGVYRYQLYEDSLELLGLGISYDRLTSALLHPDLVETAAIVLAISADWGRMVTKYGDRGYRYVLLEAGHLAQNVLLTCTAMGIAAVPIGGFVDDECGLLFGHQPPEQKLLYAVLIGHKPKHRP